MSHPHLRLVAETARDEAPAVAPRTHQEQLSLFDFRPVQRVICFPMADLHGEVFARVFSLARPSIVIDARAYPYFDLNALSRQRAFSLFEDTSSHYVHRHIDLRPPSDQCGRWRVRGTAMDVLTAFAQPSDRTVTCLAVLLNGRTDVDVLDEALRHSEAGRPVHWRVETLEGVPGLSS